MAMKFIFLFLNLAQIHIFIHRFGPNSHFYSLMSRGGGPVDSDFTIQSTRCESLVAERPPNSCGGLIYPRRRSNRRKMIARGRGRGRRPATGTEEEQAALVAASNNVVLSDSDLSFSSDEVSGDGEEAEESKSSSSRGGKGVKTESGARKPKGRGRGRTLMQPPSYSSSSLSSDLSLEEDFEKMSVTVQLEKSSDESVLSLTLPPAPQPVSEYLPPRPRITGLFPGGKVATFDTTLS